MFHLCSIRGFYLAFILVNEAARVVDPHDYQRVQDFVRVVIDGATTLAPDGAATACGAAALAVVYGLKRFDSHRHLSGRAKGGRSFTSNATVSP